MLLLQAEGKYVMEKGWEQRRRLNGKKEVGIQKYPGKMNERGNRGKGGTQMQQGNEWECFKGTSSLMSDGRLGD